MKSLNEYFEYNSKISSLDKYILENMKFSNILLNESNHHFRNIYYDENVLEELDKIIPGRHGKNRKLGLDDFEYKSSTNKGGITNKNIKEIFEKIDHIILEGCELNKFKYLSESKPPSEIGICKVDGEESIMIICFIDNYRKDDNKYDIKIKTVGRQDYEQEIYNVKLEIIIKGKYAKPTWY